MCTNFQKNDTQHSKTKHVFDYFIMDKNWQQLGKITNENIITFMSLSKSKIILYNIEKQIRKKYYFKKNSQVSIQKNLLIFRKKDIDKLQIEEI